MSLGRAGLVRPIRPLIVLATLSLALVVGSQSAMAADVISKSGQRGGWTLPDTETNPAAFCTYNVDGNPFDGQLDIVAARSPKVTARNRRPARLDSQWIGIRIQFLQSNMDGGNGGYHVV